MDSVTGRAAAESISSVPREDVRLTEAEKYVEQYDEEHGQTLHDEPRLAHPERARSHSLAAAEEVGRDRDRIRRRRQNDEAARQIQECRLRAKRNRTEPNIENADEYHRLDRAAELVVDLAEELRAWGDVVSRQCPPYARQLQECPNEADQKG